MGRRFAGGPEAQLGLRMLLCGMLRLGARVNSNPTAKPLQLVARFSRVSAVLVFWVLTLFTLTVLLLG